MNLKNSKFHKRIETLRRMSKEKLRKDRERALIDFELKNALKECDGPYVYPAAIKTQLKQERLPTHYEKAEQSEEEEEDEEEGETTPITNNQLTVKKHASGMIHLNNMCFHVQCSGSINQMDESEDIKHLIADLPTISATKGSICVSNSRYGMIGKISKSLGYKVVKEAKLWNILWTDSLPGVELYKTMKRFQQINHFPGMMEICRKDLLSRNLNRMLKLFPREYKIFPKTWIFPADYGDALNFANNHCKSKLRTFIIKPDAGAQGRGIWITNDLKNINPTERMICQTYINKPLLIDGYKFDLRVYALITSVDPLRIFVYNEGLARFATSKYNEPTTDNSTDLYMHLTNYSVNKRSSTYDNSSDDDCGSKRNFTAINNWMRSRGHNITEFWDKIDDIIIKTVLSAWPMLKHNYHACFPAHDKIQACFEILGFDVLVDSKLKPYILEVNHSPSFHMQEAVDKQVKKSLIRDTLMLISTVLADKKQILREDRKRVKQRLLKAKQPDGSVGVNSSNSNHNDKINIHHQNNYNNNNNNNKLDDNQKSIYGSKSECPLSALAQQIAWEESHLGDFRRIMPPNETNKQNYYCQFYALQNQASIYAETAASKKREEVAKKLRMQLEEKRNKQEKLFIQSRAKFDERRRKRAGLPRAILEKQRLHQLKLHAHWNPDFISDAEERLRSTWMEMRMEMLEKMQIVPLVYYHMYRAGGLTDADIVNYPDLYRSLKNGENILLNTIDYQY